MNKIKDRLVIQNSKLSKKIAGKRVENLGLRLGKLSLKIRKFQSKFYKLTKMGNWITKPNYKKFGNHWHRWIPHLLFL